MKGNHDSLFKLSLAVSLTGIFLLVLGFLLSTVGGHWSYLSSVFASAGSAIILVPLIWKSSESLGSAIQAQSVEAVRERFSRMVHTSYSVYEVVDDVASSLRNLGLEGGAPSESNGTTEVVFLLPDTSTIPFGVQIRWSLQYGQHGIRQRISADGGARGTLEIEKFVKAYDGVVTIQSASTVIRGTDQLLQDVVRFLDI